MEGWRRAESKLQHPKGGGKLPMDVEVSFPPGTPPLQPQEEK